MHSGTGGVKRMPLSGRDRTPTVSIGLAVHNGEAYLQSAVESIRGQTFADFELILSDNASTDGTEEICRAYAAQDPRVRYVRNEKNIGGANNENQTFQMSRGKYFRWAAHDDLLAPDGLAKCVPVLDSRPDVTLCYTGIVVIDEFGREQQRFLPNKALSARPSDRFRDLFTLTHNCETTYGLIRADVMRRTDLQLNYTDSDRTLLAELSLHGPFYQVAEHLFYKRYHPAMSTSQYAGWRERMAWFGQSAGDDAVSPYWMQFLHYLKIIRRSPLPSGERLRCYALMVWWAARHQRWLELAKDLPTARRSAARIWLR